MAINPSEWQWFGHAGHFFCGHACRFHMCTHVGGYLVSTIGEYVPSSQAGGRERVKNEWVELSSGRLYETMVFHAGEPCDIEDCKCGQPTLKDATELEMFPANDAGDARANHMMLCKQYAAMEKTGAAENA